MDMMRSVAARSDQVALAMVLGIFIAGAQAATIRIPADQPTIQAGINAAQVGDVVLLTDGIYSGPGNVDVDFLGKAITVQSENGFTNCVIDCQQTGRGFIFQSAEPQDAVLKDVTITNAALGGILCNASGPLITNCLIRGNAGGGITLIASGAKVLNCWISGNSRSGLGTGGGIYCEDGQPLILDNFVTGNRAYEGGGLYFLTTTGPSQQTLLKSFVAGNSAVRGGGVAYASSGLDPGNSIITKSSVCGNSSDAAGGGVYGQGDVVLEISNSRITGNVAGDAGGGIHWIGNGLTTRNSSLAHNVASLQPGGIRNGTGSIANCILWGNVPDQVLSGAVPEYCDIQDGGGGVGSLDADPQWITRSSGTWSSAGLFDPTTNQILLTDLTASWAVGVLAAHLINPDTSQNKQFYILTNTDTTITLWADWNTINSGVCAIPAGAVYQVYDYHLSASTSPCFNAGDPAFVPTPSETDIDSDPRVMNGLVDMGSDELVIPPDLDNDGDVDVNDFLTFSNCFNGSLNPPAPGCQAAGADVDSDGDVDVADFLIFANCFNGSNNPPACP